MNETAILSCTVTCRPSAIPEIRELFEQIERIAARSCIMAAPAPASAPVAAPAPVPAPVPAPSPSPSPSPAPATGTAAAAPADEPAPVDAPVADDTDNESVATAETNATEGAMTEGFAVLVANEPISIKPKTMDGVERDTYTAIVRVGDKIIRGRAYKKWLEWTIGDKTTDYTSIRAWTKYVGDYQKDHNLANRTGTLRRGLEMSKVVRDGVEVSVRSLI